MGEFPHLPLIDKIFKSVQIERMHFKNAFIFHGTAGYPEENWFPWMKAELEARGVKTTVPQFPTPENQTPEKWCSIFNPYLSQLSSDTLIIGHSLGGTFLMHVLEKISQPIGAAYFVAAPVGIQPLKNWQTDQPFLSRDFDWKKIRSNAAQFGVYHSDNDPYVCLENGRQLAENLGVPLTFVPGAGHFNAAAGFLRFEQLLTAILAHR